MFLECRRTKYRVQMLALLLCLWPCAATGQTNAGLSQRQINEYAAPLENARRMLIETPHLRGPNELLPAYLSRLLAVQAGETSAQRTARINGYLAALVQAANATKPLRRIPALCDANADNKRIWKETTQALAILPARVAKLQVAWRREQQGVPSHLSAEFQQTLYVLIAAQNGLRDARP